MAQKELHFHKEMVLSGAADGGILVEITTDRFKKGRPDLFIKPKTMLTFHVECKYEIKRKTLDYVPIETTELQKLCLKTLRAYDALTFVLVCVEIDKGIKRVYPVSDLDQETLHLDSLYFEPIGKKKGKLLWPVRKMIEQVRCSLQG